MADKSDRHKADKICLGFRGGGCIRLVGSRGIGSSQLFDMSTSPLPAMLRISLIKLIIDNRAGPSHKVHVNCLLSGELMRSTTWPCERGKRSIRAKRPFQ